jgi:ABC-type siderophore export system fused ATPase/permease subunit
MPQDPSPLPEEFLSAEFEYIANSAFQANEDRSKIASFFLVSVGSLVAAIFGAQFLKGDPDDLLIAYRSLAGLFLVLSILGALTVAQLARLRLAWYEAARAMNQMKEYVAGRYEDINLSKAFRWRTRTLPKKFKLDSISFYNMLEVALLSALTFGACVYFSMLSFQAALGLWPISLGAGGLAFIAQVLFYRILLKEKKKS